MHIDIKPHRGILINRVPVDGLAGFLFLFCVLTTLLIGIPMLRQFTLLSLPVGGIFGLVLYYWRNQTRW